VCPPVITTQRTSPVGDLGVSLPKHIDDRDFQSYNLTTIIMSLAGCGYFDRLPNELVIMIVDYLDEGQVKREERRMTEKAVW
jgi:hypothetical protein